MKIIWYGLRVKHVLEISSVRGKKMFLKIFLENTGMALDIVQQSNSHGGTSTDGNSGRCFFLVKNVLLLSNYA